MNTGYFSILGYASVIMWSAMPVLWFLHVKKRPRRWLCHIALVLGILAYVFALINSKTYVNWIQVDRSEEIAEAQARMEAARKAAEDERADDVAQVRFAEDDADDYLDTAGMDDADLKYIQTFDEDPTQAAHADGRDATPAWKKEKKQRSSTPKKDDSLEGMLDTTEQEKGMNTDVIEEESPRERIMMPEKHMMMANRLDGLNLKTIRLLILVGLGVVLVDYLKRANSYSEAYLPVPVPSSWANMMKPLETVRALPTPPRRSIVDELAWLTRRGDSFLYVSADATQVPASFPQTGRKGRPKDVLRVDESITDDFVFETLWYGRSSFVVESGERCRELLGRIMQLLDERKQTRAHVRQNVHIVWNTAVPSDETIREFERVARATGFSIVIAGRD